LAFAGNVVAEEGRWRVRDLNEKVTGIDTAGFAKYRGRKSKERKGMLAAWRSWTCIEADCTKPWDQALRLRGAQLP